MSALHLGRNDARAATLMIRAGEAVRAISLTPTTKARFDMNWTQVEGKWDQVKGAAQKQWGKLTDDDLAQAKGNRDVMVGKVKERYGIAKEEAERQVDDFIKKVN